MAALSPLRYEYDIIIIVLVSTIKLFLTVDDDSNS